MGFLKRLFGGGGNQGSKDDPDGLYYYFRSDRSGEVVQVRLHRFNDLSLMDDGKTYFSRKMVVGSKSYERMEAEFMFDGSRRLISCEVTGGELVEREDYDAYHAAQNSASAADDAE